MPKARDRLLGVLPVLVLVVVAVVTVFLLRTAQQRGIDALEESAVAEVAAIARSQDQRLGSTLSGTAGLANRPWELVEGSEADQGRLAELAELTGDELRTGFFVTDADLTITDAVNLLDRSSIGTRYERPGLAELFASDSFLLGRGGLLPVAPGVTSEAPNIGLVFPILDRTTRELRGTFVFESEVSADSDFNAEIGTLSRGDTGRFIFYDDRGTVLAANDGALIGEPLDEPRLVDGATGLTDIGGDIVVIEDVPAAGWRVAFLQDRDEFESGLATPLQTVGAVVVVVLLASATLLGVMLVRRLRAAREEEARLRQLTETQAEFVSIVSHEVRTPVAGVLGFLQTTLDHWDQMSERERLSAVRRAATNARRLQAMARDVLDTQALESGQLSFVYDTVDLATEVRAAVDVARSLYEGRRIEIEAPGDPLEVRADADRMYQVIQNLIDNAVKNSSPAEPVSVRVVASDGHAVVTVVDRGSGMTDETRARIFDKFVRADPDSVSGTGLGLYITRQIVEAHGGSIEVDSAPGRGATFTVRLPAAGPTAGSSRESDEAPHESPAAASAPAD